MVLFYVVSFFCTVWCQNNVSFFIYYMYEDNIVNYFLQKVQKKKKMNRVEVKLARDAINHT